MHDPFTILKTDHANVTELFKEYDRLDEDAQEEREKLGKLILDEVRHHTKMEEKFFYPELAKALEGEDDEYVEEAKAEHMSIKLVMAQLLVLPASSPKWSANMAVLREQIEHHVEEEEHRLIPLAEENMTDDQKDEMSHKMFAFKDNVKKGLIGRLEDKIEDFFS